MNELRARLGDTFLGYLPQILLALGILVVGWLLALAISALVKAALKRTTFDNRIAGWMTDENGKAPRVEEIIGKIVFWVLMVFVAVAFFSVLNLAAVTTPLSGFLEEIFDFLPRLLSAGLLLLLAWLVAKVLRFVVTRAIAATSLDQRLSDEVAPPDEPAVAVEGAEPGAVVTPTGEPAPPPKKRVTLSKTLGDTVYWLVFLLFLPAVLDALALEGLLEPVQALLNRLMAFLPNLLGALVILGIGWLLARVIQRIVANLLAAAGADRLGERLGIGKVMGAKRLSDLLALVVYVLILVPVVIAALDALAIDAVTVPASQMLNRVMAAIPQLFAAAVVLLLAYFIAKLVAELVSRLLAGIGFDRALARIGFGRPEPAAGEVAEAGARQPSQLVGYIVLVGVMLFATIEALRLLQFDALAGIVTEFTVFAGDVLLGVVIFAIGLYLANLAAEAIRSSGTKNADLLATFARAAILVLAGAMALRQAGMAEDIISLAFGLLLGAIAIAAAIAFGLGGREVANRYLERWTNHLESRPGSGGGGGGGGPRPTPGSGPTG